MTIVGNCIYTVSKKYIFKTSYCPLLRRRLTTYCMCMDSVPGHLNMDRVTWQLCYPFLLIQISICVMMLIVTTLLKSVHKIGSLCNPCLFLQSLTYPETVSSERSGSHWDSPLNSWQQIIILVLDTFCIVNWGRGSEWSSYSWRDLPVSMGCSLLQNTTYWNPENFRKWFRLMRFIYM